ncbi:tetratricopeptide repeat protein [Oceanobacillus sp. J11TS1]|uniref:tetratricopeptide repeat protein n=1 Tax=Oceanobacillus sp. J11TS1 TaxID=2807191 RepID=UPI001B1837F2|nr:tetratricopeptide repeat protein [Oceanobacillus sp. J11TS1]GIO22630.1 TPR repeat-containing protein YpiA [Oceanobacillus sp. J11TS1]
MNTIHKAMELAENNETEKALALLREFEKNADDDALYQIAELYLQWGFLLESRNILEKLIGKYPEETSLKLALSDIFIESEEDELAITILNEISKDDEGYVQALIQLADLYQAQGLFEVSEQKLLEAKHIEPQESIIDFALGELFFSIGEYVKAINYYERVYAKTKEVGHVSIEDRLGEAYAAAGEYEKALDFYKEEEEPDPDKLFRHGITAHQTDRNDIAMKAWQHVLEIDQDYYAAYTQLANVYKEQGMSDEAYKTVQQGIERDSYQKELFFLAGDIAHQLGKNEESEEHVRQAIALDPDYKEAVLFLIELLKTREAFNDIIELIQSIKKTGAEDALYDWELAKANVEIESFDDALNSYQDAYTSLNHDSDFLKEYGYFLTEEGRVREAIPVLKAYLEHQPMDEDVLEHVERLEQDLV